MILQLNPPIHVMTPLGEAFARLIIDYGPDLNTVWVCDIFKNRACVHPAPIRTGTEAARMHRVLLATLGICVVLVACHLVAVLTDWATFALGGG